MNFNLLSIEQFRKQLLKEQRKLSKVIGRRQAAFLAPYYRQLCSAYRNEVLSEVKEEEKGIDKIIKEFCLEIENKREEFEKNLPNCDKEIANFFLNAYNRHKRVDLNVIEVLKKEQEENHEFLRKEFEKTLIPLKDQIDKLEDEKKNLLIEAQKKYDEYVEELWK